MQAPKSDSRTRQPNVATNRKWNSTSRLDVARSAWDPACRSGFCAAPHIFRPLDRLHSPYIPIPSFIIYLVL